MKSTSKVVFRPSPPCRIRWFLIAVMGGLLLGCSEKYIYKHREYADPDDELYGMRAIERTEGSVQTIG
jgi:hypothetical protein